MHVAVNREVDLARTLYRGPKGQGPRPGTKLALRGGPILIEVKSQVGKLQQDRDPFPFRPVIPYDDDDEDDDRARPVTFCTHEHLIRPMKGSYKAILRILPPPFCFERKSCMHVFKD